VARTGAVVEGDREPIRDVFHATEHVRK
jgi:hypothetical protein